MGMDPIICPSCSEKNNPEFNECWKCHHSFLTGSNRVLSRTGSFLAKIFLILRRIFTGLALLFLVGLGFFCWGLASHVIFGKMTTGQYIHKIGADFEQEKQKILNEWTGPIFETLDRITRVEHVLNGPSREYFKSGKVRREVFYKDGKREGPAKAYYENGQVKAEGFYKNGKLAGPVKEYDEMGNLKE